jgi:galactose mutarotase-like enzyme
LALDRTLDLAETEKGWRLRLSYQVTNLGRTATPWSWAAHPLFASTAGDRIVLPESIETLRLEGSSGNRLGKNGDQVRWPVAQLAHEGETDLSLVQPFDCATGDKLFAGPLDAHENWCMLERPSAGVRIRVEFDAAATPYLGLWICSGGWPERQGPKQMCVAMEPATAPVDSLAQAGVWSRTLRAGESYSWPLLLDVETI